MIKTVRTADVTGPGQGSASRYIFITLVEVLWKYWKYDTEISDAGQHLLFLHLTGLSACLPQRLAKGPRVTRLKGIATLCPFYETACHSALLCIISIVFNV